MIVTVHTRHLATPAQKLTPCKQKQTGWSWILENWFSPTWIACPQWVKTELKLHPALGVCSGMLITKSSAAGLDEFIHRVNKIGA